AEAIESDDPELATAARAAIEQATAAQDGSGATHEDRPAFIDGLPDRPLTWAVYTREHIVALIERTAWEVVSVRPPNRPHIQDHIVCRPS
ncbi:MAG TPA: hypothetical protein VMQ81_04805, partial [Acidimicrobiia bacterium]|nr:hypothetical protein [Acidimicrobiia bacterium]